MSGSYFKFNWKNSLVILFLSLSLLLHFLYLYEFKNNDSLNMIYVDAAAYNSKALDISHGHILNKKVFYQSPLYPYLLGLTYSIFGYNILLVQIFQIIINLLSSLIIYFITLKLFKNRTIAVLSLFIDCFYNMHVFYSVLLLKVTVTSFLINLTIYFILCFLEAANKKTAMFCGILSGLSIIIRENLLLFFFIFLVYIIYKIKNRKAVIIYTLFLLMTILPVTVLNYIAAKDFILITAHKGANFYYGYNKFADGMYGNIPFIRKIPAYEYEDFKKKAEEISGKKLKPSQVSDFWFKQAAKYIISNKINSLKLTLKRFLLFWNKIEIPDNYNYYFYYEKSVILKLFPISFSIIAPLALTGLFISFFSGIIKDRKITVIIIFLLTYMFTILITHITSRYRIPAVTPIIILCSYAVYRVFTNFKKTRLFLILTVLFFIFVNFPVIQNKKMTSAYYNLGIKYEESNKIDKALSAYLESIRIGDYSLAHYQAGKIYGNSGCYDKVIYHLKKSLKLGFKSPFFEPFKAYYFLGIAYEYSGKIDKSLEYFQKSLQLNPEFEKARKELKKLSSLNVN